MGAEMTYLLTPVFFVRVRRVWGQAFRYVYVCVCVLLIGMSRSTGSWALCLSMLIFVAFIRLIIKMEKSFAAAIIGLVFVVAISIGTVFIQYPDLALRFLGKDSTLTGRTLIWGSLIISFLRSPVFGYGYEGFWTGMQGESANVAPDYELSGNELFRKRHA